MQKRENSVSSNEKIIHMIEEFKNMAEMVVQVTSESKNHFHISDSNRHIISILIRTIKNINHALSKHLNNMDPGLQKPVKMFQEVSKVIFKNLQNQKYLLNDLELNFEKHQTLEHQLEGNKEYSNSYDLNGFKEKKGGIYKVKRGLKNSQPLSNTTSIDVTKSGNDVKLSTMVGSEQCDYLFDSYVAPSGLLSCINYGLKAQKNKPKLNYSSIIIFDQKFDNGIDSMNTKDTESDQNELGLDYHVIPFDFEDEDNHVRTKNPYLPSKSSPENEYALNNLSDNNDSFEVIS